MQWFNMKVNPSAPTKGSLWETRRDKEQAMAYMSAAFIGYNNAWGNY